jgi:putative ABC transport system ATP-binding protein
VVVTHDERVAATADRLISMRDGAFAGDTAMADVGGPDVHLPAELNG